MIKFNQFITSPSCPESVKIAYSRVKERHRTKTTHVEPVASNELYAHDEDEDIDDETRTFLDIAATFTKENNPIIDIDGLCIDKRIDYDWDKPIHPVSFEFNKPMTVYHMTMQRVD